MAKRVIDLDAERWSNVLDFYSALLEALGAPAWHGKSVDALVDSIIWSGIKAVEPPYKISIRHAAGAPKDVLEEIELAKQALAEHRLEFRARRGHDIDVSLETTP